MIRSRVIVVGGGVFGCALLLALAEDGVPAPTLIERYRFGSGASAMSGGILRRFHLDSTWSDLARESFARLLSDSLALRVATPISVLHLFSAAQAARADAELARLSGPEMPLTRLSPAAAEARFPGFVLEGAAHAVLEEDAVYTDPVALCRHWVKLATACGALAVEGAEVELVLEGGAVQGVRTPWGVERADVVILALGGLAPSFMTRHGVPSALRTRAICAHVFAAAPCEGPAVIDNGTGLYGRPDFPDGWLVGTPAGSEVISEELLPIAEHRARTLALAQRRLRFLDTSRYRGARTALDAFSVDERPGLFVEPNVAGLFLMSGASGGGVKVAPQVARNVVSVLKHHGAI